MGRSRRARRKAERARAKRPQHRHAISPWLRIGLVVIGVVLIAGGISLLIAGTPGTAARLGRIAGIVILLGVVAVVAAAIGHV